MKLTPVILLAALGPALEAQTIPIYLSNRSAAPQQVIYAARTVAGKLFRDIGIEIEWRIGNPGPSVEGLPLVLTITDNTPDDYHRGALADAYPFERIHIQILYDRVLASTPLRITPLVLAHVMAHEIAHMLQAVNRHSRSGMMKANWSHEDYLTMQRGELRFEPFDIQLIQRGVATRSATQYNSGHTPQSPVLRGQ
jgi:hypothetical protein